jgi:hypothetical protein
MIIKREHALIRENLLVPKKVLASLWEEGGMQIYEPN